MAKQPTITNKETKKRVEQLGDLPAGEERAPRGISSFDIGAPPDAEQAAAALEEETKAIAGAIADELGEGHEAQGGPAVRTHEEWAKEAGYLPAVWRNPAAYRNGRLRAVAPTPNPKHWIYAGAKAHHAWPIGQEMTKAQFDAAVASAHDFTIG